MSSKTNSGGDAGDSSSSSSSGGVQFPGGVSGKISVDTDALHNAADSYRGVGDNFRTFAQQCSQHFSQPPLLNGESDETWDQFGPSYMKGAQAFVDGAAALSKAAHAVMEGVHRMASAYEAADENATQQAQQLRNVMGEGGGVPTGWQPPSNPHTVKRVRSDED